MTENRTRENRGLGERDRRERTGILWKVVETRRMK